MQVTDLLLTDIVEVDRGRKITARLEGLKTSLTTHGLLHPIVVYQAQDKFILIAGSRRLAAARELEWEKIAAQVLTVDELTAREIELEENLHREDLTEIDEVQLLLRIHRLKQAKHGMSTQGKEGGWTLQNTADALGVSIGKVHLYCKIAQALEQQPELEKIVSSKGVAAASKFLDYQAEMKEVYEKVQEQELAPKSDIRSRFVCADCREHITTIADNSVSIILTDPPYGKGLDEANWWGTDKTTLHFDDSAENFWDLIWSLIPEFNRVLAPNSYLVMWTAFSNFEKVTQMLKAVGLTVHSQPFIWLKEQPSFYAPYPGRSFAVGSEFAIVAWKGEPTMSFPGHPNYLVCPSPLPENKIHPFTKSIAVLYYILNSLCHPAALVYDPFAGSGTTLIAAHQLGLPWLGCEKDQLYYGQAIVKLKAAIGE